MRIKLLVVFQFGGFALKSERPVIAGAFYASFWDDVKRQFESSGHPRDSAVDLRFTHSSPFTRRTSQRYISIDDSSLVRPLHMLEVYVDSKLLDLPESIDSWRGRQTSREAETDQQTIGPRERIARLVQASLYSHPNPVLVRVYDHEIGLAEVDLILDRLAGESDQSICHIEPSLDELESLVVHVAEDLTKRITPVLHSLFRDIANCPSAADYIVYEPPLQHAEVLWTARALIFEDKDVLEGDRRTVYRLNIIIEHWLKNVRGNNAEAVIRSVRHSTKGYSTEWLNYLFREKPYSGPYPDVGWHVDPHGLAEPFCKQWNAMIHSQFYYAAFDVMQTRIHTILAQSFTNEHAGELRPLKDRLDDIVKRATLLLLDYHENFKLYDREIAHESRRILNGWQLDTILARQFEKGIEACTERINQLHERVSQRSSLYTDIILLGIGITSVFSILLTLIQHGRDTATNKVLAAYERGYLNIIDWVASRSTDGILFAGLIISIGLVALYYFFKRQRIL